MAGGSDGEKVKWWRERLQRHATWAGTVEDFCRTEGVSVPTFYHWRKKLARSVAGRQSGKAPRFRPVVVTPSVTVTHAALRAPGPAALTVRLPGGAHLEVPRENLEAVRVVVAELVRADQGLIVGDDSC